MPGIVGASIDVETTGLNAGVHEIVEIAIVAHDRDFKPTHRLTSYIKPLRPAFADPKAMEVNKLSLKELEKAPTPPQVRNVIYQWHDEVLDGKRMMPLGSNFAFDQSFLKLMFGPEIYSNLFTYAYRDTSIFARGLRDSGSLEVPSTSLATLAEYFDIPHKAHSAEGDALAALQVYKRLTNLP